MCRRNQLLGWCLAAFGVGLLVGAQINAGFWCSMMGLGVIVFGFVVIIKK